MSHFSTILLQSWLLVSRKVTFSLLHIFITSTSGRAPSFLFIAFCNDGVSGLNRCMATDPALLWSRVFGCATKYVH